MIEHLKSFQRVTLNGRTWAVFLPSTIVILSHLFNFLLNPDGVTHPDSFGYGLSSENGNQAYPGLRSNLMVLFYTNLSNPETIILFQHLLAVCVEVYFIRRISSSVIPERRVILSWLVSIFLTIPPVMSIHSTLLSESISTSFAILLISQILHPQKRKVIIFVTATIFAAWASLKSINAIMAIFIFCAAIVLILLAFVKEIREKKVAKIQAITLIVLFLSICFLTLNLQRQSKADFGGVNYLTVSSVLKISSQNPFATDLLKKIPNSKLDCPWSLTPEAYFDNLNRLIGDCKRDQKWFSEHFQTWYFRSLLSNPKLLSSMVAQGFLAGTTPVSYYGSAVSFTPSFFKDFFYGNRNLSLRETNEEFKKSSIDNLVLTCPFILWLIFYLYSLAHFGYRNPIIIIQGICLIGIAMVSILSPNEWYRQSIQFTTVFYLLSIANCLKLFERK